MTPEENIATIRAAIAAFNANEVADDEMLVHHWHSEGTVKATGNPIRWEGCSWMRIENGLIAEAWIFWDPSQLQPRRTVQEV